MDKYIDVHCHLESEKFNEDLDEVIKRAKENNVLIVQSGVNPETNRQSLEMKEKYNILCSFGLYPIDSIAAKFDNLKDDYVRDIKAFNFDEELNWIKEHKDDCVLIGEVGLDFKVIECDEEIKSAQIENFEKVIDLSLELNKPILIHSRGAELDATEILEKKGAKRVIMHCFCGKKSLIKRGVENGWFFSVPAIITRLQHFETLVGLVPLSQLLTETDAPLLSPERETRNEPVNVMITVKKIAEIKGLDEEEVRKQLLENAKELLEIN